MVQIKIIDFGSAVLENPAGPPLYYDSFHGTKSYASPEIITQRYYRAGPADIWSLGIILHILLTGEQPFESTEMVLRGRIRRPRDYSGAAADLLDGMLQGDPDFRFDIHDVMQHTWTRGVGQFHIPRHHSHGQKQQISMPGSVQSSRSQQPSMHQSTDTAGSIDSIGRAQAQMMDAVAVPMYDTGNGLMGLVTGTASMAWAQEHCYASQ
jgi:serine/threonine protein kinase